MKKNLIIIKYEYTVWRPQTAFFFTLPFSVFYLRSRNDIHKTVRDTKFADHSTIMAILVSTTR